MVFYRTRTYTLTLASRYALLFTPTGCSKVLAAPLAHPPSWLGMIVRAHHPHVQLDQQTWLDILLWNAHLFCTESKKADDPMSVLLDLTGQMPACSMKISFFPHNYQFVTTRDGRPAPRRKQAAPPCPGPKNIIAPPPRKISLLPRPAPPRGGGQNCGAFVGQNENHTLNFINGDND